VTIARFEAVFFNVVDRLRARDYLAMLLRRGTRDADGRLDVATVIKTVAFTSGLAALELLLRDVLDDTGNLKPFGSFDWATKQGRDCARLRLLCAAIQLPDTLAIACELEHCHKALLEADNSMVPCAEESGAIEQAVDQALIQALHDIANTKAVGAEQSALFNVRADRVVA
jgi:hypothetical protein